MTTSPPNRPRLRRALLVLLSMLTVALLAVPTSGAVAKRGVSSPPPSPDRITLEVDGLDLPVAAGTPDLLLLADAPFDLTVTFRAGSVPTPYSSGTATHVTITLGDGTTLASTSVAAGQSSVTVEDLRLPAANGVVLTAQAVGRKAAADLLAGTAGPFDAVLTAETVLIAEDQRGGDLFVSSTRSTDPCTTTSDPGQQTCVDVLLPNGVSSDVFFSTGLCTGDIGCLDENGIVLQVLADLAARYTPEAPATLVVRCDKSRCGGGSIQDNGLQVNLDPVGDLTTSPACRRKGNMSGPDGHCIDYVQSRRDGSGDTYLYLLITRDARMSH